MLRKKTKKPSIPVLPGRKIDPNGELFHPLSYYLLGGTDLSGDALDKSASVEYDSDEDLAILEDEGSASVAIGDPRVGFFDIVEQAGVKGADKVTAKSPKPSAEPTTTTTE